MTNKLEITKENLQKAYENACEKGKKVLEDLFPGKLKNSGMVQTGGYYWYIDPLGGVEDIRETNNHSNHDMFNFGNYFHFKEQAEQVLNGVQAEDWRGGVVNLTRFGLKNFFKSWQRYFGIID